MKCLCECGKKLIKKKGKTNPLPLYASRKCWQKSQMSTVGNFYAKGIATDKLFADLLGGDSKAKEQVNSKGARLTYWKRGGEEYKSH